MKQNKRGILMLTSMILSISLMCGAQAVKASISGCKYNDTNNNGEIDQGEEKLSGWDIQLISCPYAPLEEGALKFLPKSNINTNPCPGMTGYCSVIKTIATGEDGCYSFTGLEVGNYGISEVTQENWTQTFPADNTFYYFDLMDGEAKTDIDFLNYYEEPVLVYQCSDEIDNDGDGLIDADDPGCWKSSGNPESYDPEDDDEDEITPPDGADIGNPTTPNPNSGVTLYRVDGDPRVYVIKNKKKYWIHTPKEFNDNGYSWGRVKIVSAKVLEGYSDAEDSTIELLRVVGSYKVYKIENGKKSWIKTVGEFNAAGYKWKDIKDVSLWTLASYQSEVLSELLRATGSCKVYKIENGKKRWIKTAEEFNAAGHRWENVEDIDAGTLDNYPDSE